MNRAVFEVWQDGMMVASTSGPRDSAEQDAYHYALMYGQDGPVEVFEIIRGKKVAAKETPHG